MAEDLEASQHLHVQPKLANSIEISYAVSQGGGDSGEAHKSSRRELLSQILSPFICPI